METPPPVLSEKAWLRRPGEYPGERPTWHEVLLVIPAVLPLFLNLGILQVTGSEARWLLIARDMEKTGQLLEPRIEGEFYGDKPLISYWTILLAALPSGRVDEAAGRLPSAVAGAVSGFLTLWLAARLLGRRASVLAAWILLTSFSFFVWSRTASADLLSVAFSTAAVAVYIEWSREFRPWKVIFFFLLLAVGGHVKGMPGVLVPLGIVGADLVLSLGTHVGHPRFRTRLLVQGIWVALGCLLASALYFVPFYLSYLERGDWQLLYLAYKENFLRAFDAYDHVAPPYYYLWILPLMFLPWGLLLPGAVGWAARWFRQNAGLRFCLVAFAVTFIEFTASESRRSYYIIPAFPFCALLVAGFLSGVVTFLESGKPPGRAWLVLASYPLFLLAAALALGAAFFLTAPFLSGPLGQLGREFPLALPLGSALVAMLVLWVVAWRGRNPVGLVAAGAIAALTFTLYFSLGGDVLRARALSERPFAQEVRSRFPDTQVVYFRGKNTRLSYYLGTGPVVKTFEEARDLLEEGRGEVLLVLSEDDIKDTWPPDFAEVIRTERPAFGFLSRPNVRFTLLRCTKK